MDTQTNLLFGVLALQVDLINNDQFTEVCTRWSTRKNVSLADLLVEFGWITPEDKEDVDRLLVRRMKKHGEDVRASLAASLNQRVDASLERIMDADLRNSMVDARRMAQPILSETMLHIPTSNDRYHRKHLHAKGGIGEIWLARDCQLGRDVALKNVRSEMAKDSTVTRRFLNEAQINGQLEHPGIVPVYELAANKDEQPFYSMRFVNGRTLKHASRAFHEDRVAGQPSLTEFSSLLNAFVTVCKTIAYAHSRGVIHRDLKGENVILGDFGEVVVLDWGLAKLEGTSEEATEAPPVAIDQDEGPLTLQGHAVGTPGYMAPEQAMGRIDLIDCRTDVYGLGAMLYHLLTGKPPFKGENFEELLRKVQFQEPIPPKQLWDGVPDTLQAACLKALAKERSQRFDSAREFAEEVEQWQEDQRQQAVDALRESESLYQSLVECVSLNVWRKDLQGRFTYVNKGLCDVLGMSKDDIIGKTDYDISPAELAEKYRRDDEKVQISGETLRILEPMKIMSNNSATIYEVIKIPIYDARGKIAGTQGVCWDTASWNRGEADAT